jgi:2-polyprenyl-3-methyl-5-hydroxy-6-metoxy-1,4-benzoquinol methylase
MQDDKYVYQYGYSETFAEYQFDRERQNQKARKTLSVLSDYYEGTASLSSLTLLDIGCSAGLMTRLYGERFGRVVGIDIDEPAVNHASQSYSDRNLEFLVRDSMNTGFEDETFDVVTCTHIYEHVPDADRLLEEIHRVLKKGGVCYFAAQNRLCWQEPHYFLPLLSVMPKSWAHVYVRLFGKGEYYYENLRTLTGLRKLVKRFHIVDYTTKVMKDPERYHATELLKPGSLKQKLALLAAKCAYYLCPTYIWLLRKD